MVHPYALKGKFPMLQENERDLGKSREFTYSFFIVPPLTTASSCNLKKSDRESPYYLTLESKVGLGSIG